MGDKRTTSTLFQAADVRPGVAEVPTLWGLGQTWRTNQRAESETLNHSRRRGGVASDLRDPRQFHFTIVPDKKTNYPRAES